ncbi:putative glycosyltransferase (exosortase G-associated) [Mobilisporobacter senegalensis]|uniref:Putative glycosyltransferase (Exosortase G-associated) n=1 Tax=Mobilisporobacter senegalensis TaxID=1329262 RepID=A0A3N1XR18_9FIRM|nr:TIGR03111 family XrtG-associated glycosyltransferase [Mobilisporobacter senegalensis]ROR28728.1 putative glycosyltransferase (exosortase G-associated) [Mobilisporobacter senegalensis]
MNNILKILSNKICFWASWVVIPLIMEIIPAILGFFILIKKKIEFKSDMELSYFPHITLIIPVYNSAGSLEQCLDSVLNSSYPTDKIYILLVNNGSKDESFKIFQDYQYSHSYMNMKWMNAHQGKSKALNMALFNSSGKYIIHIDSDGILHPDAILNLVRRFESHENINCMTGVILTNPDLIDETKKFSQRLLKEIEFYEYAQAFLAGRNYEAEINSIFTLSGAFSAFRKSTILKTQLYNTETVCEDTHVTFQVRRLLNKKIDLCENAIFFVDPIENVQTLYVQRQRWQRGEIEVAHMFPETDGILVGFFRNFMLRLLIFDHTFAFPRMIWYFALICLTFLDYPFQFIMISIGFIYFLYTVSAFLYYLNICSYLNWEKKLRNYYAKRLPIIFMLPLFNFMMYWFRFAGIINSIKGQSNWKTKSLKEEKEIIKSILSSDLFHVKKYITKLKQNIYYHK